jgi:hypothetical protein
VGVDGQIVVPRPLASASLTGRRQKESKVTAPNFFAETFKLNCKACKVQVTQTAGAPRVARSRQKNLPVFEKENCHNFIRVRYCVFSISFLKRSPLVKIKPLFLKSAKIIGLSLINECDPLEDNTNNATGNTIFCLKLTCVYVFLSLSLIGLFYLVHTSNVFDEGGKPHGQEHCA